MRVFVDGGAHTGDTFDWVSPGSFDKVIMVEPNKKFWDRLGQIAQGNISLCTDALSDGDGEAPFYASLWSDLGDSLLQSKGGEPMSDKPSGTVRVVDTARWLEDMTGPEDRVTMKLDIEGSEYAVLDRVLSHPVAGRIERLMIEWHPIVPVERRDALIDHIRSLGIAYEEWEH